MSHVIIPYSAVVIPNRDKSSEKIVYAPIVDTFLYNVNHQTNFSFRSIVDSGADFCVFPARFGEIIGLDIKKGDELSTFGIGGKEILYFHTIDVAVMLNKRLLKFKCNAGFSFKMNAKGIGLLGRKGFFDLFAEVSFNQNKKMLKLKELVE